MDIPSLSIRSFFPVLVLLFLEIPSACYCQVVKEPKADSTELYYSEAARVSDPFKSKIPADSLLQEIMARNERNPEIVFRTGTGKALSVEQILAPYKGKCVYLDIWGSWCA